MRTLQSKLFIMFSLSLALTLMTTLSQVVFLVMTQKSGECSCSVPEAHPPHQKPSSTGREATATKPFQTKMIKKAACSSDGLFLLIYVHSSAENVFQRYLLRKTWGSSQVLRKLNASMVFILGRTYNEETSEAISREAESFGDIVMGDFQDSYRNMHLKALAGLEWVTKHCSKARFLLKADDDMFVDIFALVSHLVMEVDKAAGHKGGVLQCNYWDEGQRIIPRRDPSSKWYVSEEEYGKPEFPPFCQGAAYISTVDVASALYRKAAEVRPIWLDDVYITGLVRDAAEISPSKLNDAFFENYGITIETIMERIAQDQLLFVHGLPNQVFAKFWNIVLKVNGNNSLEQMLLQRSLARRSIGTP